MAERGEVEVLVPVNRPPSVSERVELVRVAAREASRLVAPLGRVLAMTRVTRAETAEGQLALKIRFVCSGPDHLWERAKTVNAGSWEKR